MISTTTRTTTRKNNNFKPGQWLGEFSKYTVLILFALFSILPLVLMWTAALRKAGEVNASPFALPKTPRVCQLCQSLDDWAVW